jgi:hypothetical protein
MNVDGTGCRKLLTVPNSLRFDHSRANQIQSPGENCDRKRNLTLINLIFIRANARRLPFRSY